MPADDRTVDPIDQFEEEEDRRIARYDTPEDLTGIDLLDADS